MNVILLAALSLIGLAFALGARAMIMNRTRSDAALQRIGSYGFRVEREAGERRGLYSVVDGLASAMGAIVGRRFGTGREREIRNRLMAAGMYGVTPRKFVGYRALSAVGTPLVWAWFGTVTSFPLLFVIVGTFIAVVFGWSAPEMLVRRRADRRFRAIDFELPELVDVLVVSVEAGLGFSGSMQVASERMHGPLGDELRLTLQEQNMGLSTQEALRHLLERCDTPFVRSFVRSVLQGESLGVSIGQIMRDLATDIRKRRRQAAEERAQKAPIKILFPLIFLIFPAMFVILLGPAVFNFLDTFRGS
jgi:tight adherence protein C